MQRGWCTAYRELGGDLRDTHTPFFRCEEPEHFAKMSSDPQPFSSLHRITKNTLGKQSILWGIVKCWPNDWQEVKGSFNTDSNKNCWWIHNKLHGMFQKKELTEGFLTFSCLKSTCTTMGLHSEPFSHTHAQKNPSEEYFINTSNTSKEFENVSILLSYLLGVLCWCWPNASQNREGCTISLLMLTTYCSTAQLHKALLWSLSLLCSILSWSTAILSPEEINYYT